MVILLSVVVRGSAILEQREEEEEEEDWGRTLFEVSVKGDADRVRRLLVLGADIEWRVNGWTPLIAAAFHGRDEVVKILLKSGANTEARINDMGGTALIMATENNHDYIVRMLLDAGADKDAKDNDGYDALRVAQEEKLQPIIDLLLGCSSPTPPPPDPLPALPPSAVPLGPGWDGDKRPRAHEEL